MSRPLVRRIPGAQIDLVDIEPAYFGQVIAWRNDPKNQRSFFSQQTWTFEGQCSWYERYRNDPADLTFVIVSKSAIPVGTIGLYAIDEQARTAEFGRLLIGNKLYEGRGIAYEASRLCLDFAFNTLGLRQVYLEVYDWNVAAIRLYEKLGFVTVEYTQRCGVDGIAQRVRQMTVFAHTQE